MAVRTSTPQKRVFTEFDRRYAIQMQEIDDSLQTLSDSYRLAMSPSPSKHIDLDGFDGGSEVELDFTNIEDPLSEQGGSSYEVPTKIISHVDFTSQQYSLGEVPLEFSDGSYQSDSGTTEVGAIPDLMPTDDGPVPDLNTSLRTSNVDDTR